MSSCHATPSDAHHVPSGRPRRGAVAEAAPARVVLLGNPNVGKSTLFNGVTGARQQVVNAPGTTVNLAVGAWRTPGHRIDLVDLPGTYSLVPNSPDERVSADAVIADGGDEYGRVLDEPDLTVVIADANALSRSLYLLAQLAAVGRPCLLALTMVDVAARRGRTVDADRLRARLGIPVVAINPRAGAGRTALARAVDEALDRPERCHPGSAGAPGLPEGRSLRDGLPALAADQLAWVAEVVADAVPPASPRRTASDRVDAVLLDPWLGIPVFLAVVWAVFQLTTTVAAPLQDGLGNFVTGPLSHGVTALFGLAGAEDSWACSLVVDGVLNGAGTVLSFVPLMAIMFVCLGVLEDSGYMARAAFVMDRAMRVIGLDGRAFLPFVVGFGCNVPALDATRTLPQARQRLLAGLLVPFTNCSARLTVFLLMAATFFPPRWAGTVVFGLYLASVLLIIGFGWILRRTWFRDLVREPLVLQLPAYHVPALRPTLTSVWVRLQGFVVKAGRIIVVTLVAVWFLQAVPLHSGAGGFGHVADIHASLYGGIADGIAPAFTWAGFANWSMAMALMAGFVAKEVVIGTLGQAYALDPDADQAGLEAHLHRAMEASSGGHPAAAALAFMVFVLAYTPCLATVGEQRRLFGARPAALSVAMSVVVAWLLAVAVFQIGRLL